jgi:hypothetical protein
MPLGYRTPSLAIGKTLVATFIVRVGSIHIGARTVGDRAS